MCSIRIISLMLFQTLALLLAVSVGLAGMASASTNHTSHCVPVTERADAQHAMSDAQIGKGTHTHVVAQAENTDASATDCLPHFCAAVLIGPVRCDTASHTAMPLVVPEPANLRALSRIFVLYRPPSL